MFFIYITDQGKDSEICLILIERDENESSKKRRLSTISEPGQNMIDTRSLSPGVSYGEDNTRPFGEGLPNMVDPVLNGPRSPA